MKVLKFWWTSVWSLENIKKTAEIIIKAKQSEDIVVVVSAMSWVTNTLSELCIFAHKWKTKKVQDILKTLKDQHTYVIEKLCNNSCNIKYLQNISMNLERLNDILKWVSLLMEVTDKTRAKILLKEYWLPWWTKKCKSSWLNGEGFYWGFKESSKRNAPKK